MQRRAKGKGMTARGIGFFVGSEFLVDPYEVNRQNRLAIRYLARAGSPIALANIVSQLVNASSSSMLRPLSLVLPAYFIVLYLFDRFVLPENYQHATALAYVIEAPIMLISLLLGTVWDPTHQAFTILMAIAIMPVFILDRPVRVMAVMLGWSVAFMLVCASVKEPYLIASDFSHVIEFYLSSIAVFAVVVALRLNAIRSLERANYHLAHDTLTNTKNQYGLVRSAPDYTNKELFIVVASIDHLTFINDYYGREVGDDLLCSFAAMLKDLFGNENIYRYGGDEMLCVSFASDDSLTLLDECRTRLGDLRDDRMYTRPTCAIGYVTGTPTSDQELQRMIQLADIYAHKAKREGEGKTSGGPFDQVALSEGIVEASIVAHARAYEINQLTGLPSMAYFITRSEEVLHVDVEMDRRPVVGFFNIVRFRDFNDKFGYAKGDELIRHTADLLREALPQRHITYISGGQFGVLCYEDEIDSLLDHVSSALLAYKSGYAVKIKAGFARYRKGDAVISLLDKAKLAHASISDNKELSWYVYDRRLDEEIRFRQYLVSHVDEAIEKEWVKVQYQPIVSASTGKTCNMEALSRWDDPLYGFLPPYKFIGVLEQERLIYKLSLYVVRRVLKDFARMEMKGFTPVPVSINLSRTDFFETDMVEEITALVDESGYSRQMINIEITESAFAEDKEMLKVQINRFRERGFAVWMDDFGSEYSTLNLLEELDFDLIKADMQFMRNFAEGGRNAIILADIIGMCRRLGITTLVEGVETEQQYKMLRDLGTDKLQGYLFSRPRDLDELMVHTLANSG